MTKIQKLHQICSGFMYDNDREVLYVPSGKFQVLTEQLETGLQDHDKAVIFTAFRAEPALVANAIAQMSRPIKVFVLPEKGNERQPAIDEWSSWTCSPAVFIANIASGGVGLNLQAAHTAIFFSNDYKLQGREQAVDRVYRMGSDQHQKILIQDLVTEGTVDEDILKALQSKRSVVDVFLERLKEETGA
jgi:SNF2 family DNA or RNA helicase